MEFYTLEDTRLIELGSALHNKKSRMILEILATNKREYYLKELASIIEDHPNPRLPIYEYHIKTLVRSGLVSMRIKMHNKHKTKFYKCAPCAIIDLTHVIH